MHQNKIESFLNREPFCYPSFVVPSLLLGQFFLSWKKLSSGKTIERNIKDMNANLINQMTQRQEKIIHFPGVKRKRSNLYL